MKKWMLPVVALSMSIAVASAFAQAPAKDAPRTGADKATPTTPKQDTGMSSPGVGAPGTDVGAKAAEKGRKGSKETWEKEAAKGKGKAMTNEGAAPKQDTGLASPGVGAPGKDVEAKAAEKGRKGSKETTEKMSKGMDKGTTAPPKQDTGTESPGVGAPKK